MATLEQTLASLGVNTSSPAVTNFSSNPGFQTWAPTVAQTANSKGVDPTTALALVGQESSWNPNALSETSGAYGFTQTLPSTASDPGYGLSSWSPYLPQSNIEGGIGYFSQLLKNNNGDYAAALTSYNGNSDPNYSSKVLGLTQAEPSAEDIVNGGVTSADTANTPKGGILGTSAAKDNFFTQLNEWLKTGAITIVVVLIAVLLIVFGSMSILQPVAGKVAKALPLTP